MLVSQNYEKMELAEFVKKAYLDYSMSVILDRALPHIGDGLKPVQRRIIFAMSQLSLHNSAKPKKCARTVGDVLGKFHPHGDSACYEAMVLMSQSFSTLYPLIEGHGNFGSADDPKSFAAMRYTEAKLSAFAELLLDKINQGTVQWQPNFDGTLQEPKLLPSAVPHIVLNGTTGIAVSMATDIPPHNLAEICKACIKILQSPNLSEDQLFKLVPAPDYPTAATIISKKEEIEQVYKTGKGSIRTRAVYMENGKNIIINHLPYQVSPSKIIKQIGSLIQSKKLLSLDDIRDESDHENPIRIVLHIKGNRQNATKIMQNLYALTDLEKSFRVNMNMIGINGRPQVKSLLVILQEWLSWRINIVKLHHLWRLDKISKRLHILDGLLIAYLNLDEVIRIIREEDEPKIKLMQKFSLSEIQADAILETKLKNLARLEQIKIKAERDLLKEEQNTVKEILSDQKNLKKEVISELKEAIKKYPNSRISPIVEMEKSVAINIESLQPTYGITVILSKHGWIRAAKGHNIDIEKLNYKQSDGLFKAVELKSTDEVVIIDNTGRAYSIAVINLPSARGLGEPISSKIKLSDGAVIIDMIGGLKDTDKILFSTNAGYGFMSEFQQIKSKLLAGKQIINIGDNNSMLPPIIVQNEKTQKIISISSIGYMLCFDLSQLPTLSNAKGVKIINIPAKSRLQNNEILSKINLFYPNDKIILNAGKRIFTINPSDIQIFMGKRALRGKKLPRGLCGVDTIQIKSSLTSY
ncbi:MAG: DNA topoisomerase IV subunit A [Gammaproteobacteria bacterium]|nr:MAG: DNA topoisomerase IV subunit A [Gammaproteobacteria bacterium]